MEELRIVQTDITWNNWRFGLYLGFSIACVIILLYYFMIFIIFGEDGHFPGGEAVFIIYRLEAMAILLVWGWAIG